ncbi:PAS domain S-box protein [Sphingomonas abietis]|uniref:PAS domain S-box protein n=1 Tax=Sphingomonas abietis TaxID=3012344 RepID=A0ABY7NHZ8_9SPHN|nr:PAS domain S-box protein [Sphingomonas abietis]WBO21109.1 PAS domain S-box protein [Sphingomonas abietis]
MMVPGHVLIDAEGHLLSCDQGFCDILRAEPASVVGRLVQDVTAPADREECAAAIARLRATRKPFQISKRFLRDDGSLVWVANSVSMIEGAVGPALIVATINPIVDTGEDRAPARLLSSAHFLVTCKNDRASICDVSLFPDTAWDAMLAAYIAEAEGRSIDVAALSAQLDISPVRAGRWIAILLRQGVIEIETRRADAYAPKSFRLTAAIHARLEDHLSRVDLQSQR